jgi:hypothetical protein
VVKFTFSSMFSLFTKSLALAAALAQPLSPERGSVQLLELEGAKKNSRSLLDSDNLDLDGGVADAVPDAMCEVVPMDDAWSAVA